MINHYESARKKIIDALGGEPLELKFGCEVVLFGIEYLVIQNKNVFLQLYPYKRDKHGLDGNHHLRKNSNDWKYLEILGRPLTLEDVFLAIGESKDKQGSLVNEDKVYEKVMWMYRWGKPFSDQPPALHKFIDEILV